MVCFDLLLCPLFCWICMIRDLLLHKQNNTDPKKRQCLEVNNGKAGCTALFTAEILSLLNLIPDKQPDRLVKIAKALSKEVDAAKILGILLNPDTQSDAIPRGDVQIVNGDA
jgi:hypothetical protein